MSNHNRNLYKNNFAGHVNKYTGIPDEQDQLGVTRYHDDMDTGALMGDIVLLGLPDGAPNMIKYIAGDKGMRYAWYVNNRNIIK